MIAHFAARTDTESWKASTCAAKAAKHAHQTIAGLNTWEESLAINQPVSPKEQIRT